MVEKLKMGPYEIGLLPLFQGPLPAILSGTAEEPLAALLNEAVANSPDFLEAIRRRGEAGNPMCSVGPPLNDDEGRALAEEWRAKTGEVLAPHAIARIGMLGQSRPLAVSWQALQDALETLVSLRAAWTPEPGPWLFVQPARSGFVTPADHEIIQSLEREAAAIDALDLEAEVGSESPALIARRRRFLAACGKAGVFDAAFGAEREKWLDYWLAARLLALRRAALQLRAWDLLDPSSWAGPVCLDYSRLQLWAPGGDGRLWAEKALKLLAQTGSGDQGVVEERISGRITARAWWRRDAELPALLAVESPVAKET
jgi:hypothetical protein